MLRSRNRSCPSDGTMGVWGARLRYISLYVLCMWLSCDTLQCKNHKWSQGRWPRKSVEVLLQLLKNAESNAEVKMMNTDALVIEHISVQRAAHMRRRTYRAHGRINREHQGGHRRGDGCAFMIDDECLFSFSAYMSSPCHIEMYLTEKDEPVPKPEEEVKQKKKVSQKKLKRQKLKAALTGGAD